MSKQKRILAFFGQENKREEHRPQTEIGWRQKHMTISVEGPSVESYDFNKAVLLWRGKKERRIFKKTT